MGAGTPQIRAILTAQLGNGRNYQYPTRKVEAFQIDSALDTDADAFSIEVGHDAVDLIHMIHRDTEVRVSVFTQVAGSSEIEQLHTGIADNVRFSTDNFSLSVTGRDLSCVASDSDAPPGETKWVRPSIFISKEARALGITNTRLAHVSQEPKFYRDGSETYWESWYRLYRSKKMWMWFEPDGTLVADFLNYSVSANYKFGSPPRGQSTRSWYPVKACEITKDNQQRVGTVYVFGVKQITTSGEQQKVEFVGKATDPTISSWIRKPVKYVTSSTVKNQAAAIEQAYEEVFEGKVGALEIALTVPFTGQIIRQNTMAEVNLPAIGLHGEFFVVGTQLSGGADGHLQVVRLREKGYAISKRQPSEPSEDAVLSAPGQITDIGKGLTGALPNVGKIGPHGIRWANSFVAAAQEFHDGWDFNLFLAVLLAICEHESHFGNLINGDSVTEYPGNFDSTEHFRDHWANNPGNPRLSGNARSVGKAVGPMQLLTMAYKEWADEYGGVNDEYRGGRWTPQANIRAGARAFAGKLSGLDPQESAQIYIGVGRYYGSSSQSANAAYGETIRQMAQKYLQVVTAANTSSPIAIDSNAQTLSVTDANGNAFVVEFSTDTHSVARAAVLYALRQLGKPYQWGADGPNSFDCSGLCVAAYRAAGGPSLIHNTNQMFAQLDTVVPKNLLKMGDLVFFEADLGHMGMYLNSGHFIQAPHTGDVVKISSLNSGWYAQQFAAASAAYGSAARRVV